MTVPARRSSYIEKLDVKTRLELDRGVQHIVDVQPDLRFPFQYFLYNVSEQYPELSVKGHPYVSTFTLVAYQQILFNAYLLICDLHTLSRYTKAIRYAPTSCPGSWIVMFLLTLKCSLLTLLQRLIRKENSKCTSHLLPDLYSI